VALDLASVHANDSLVAVGVEEIAAGAVGE
jgi:hypothetical protein